MSTNSNTRAHSRSEIDTKVNWSVEGVEKEGHSHDLSLNGVYITTDDKPDLKSTIDVHIFLPGDPSFPRINVQATVVRQDENGFAAQFEELDFDSFEHLKKLVAYNSNNPEKVFEELEKPPESK